jgi:hypothetical protein
VKEGESVLQGICVDTGETTVLEKGKKYFLFPRGLDHYYVSKFPRETAHCGCFHKSLFQIIQEDEWPPEPAADNVPVLDSSKIYAAKLIWRKRGYQQVKLGTYFIQPARTHAYLFRDRQLEKCIGCFPLHWFEGFKEIAADEDETNEVVFEKNEMIVETKVLESETKEEKHEIFEQMCIFDFIE